jgi:GAF domain-containing protein
LAELFVINGVCAGTVFFLPDVPTVLGRSPEAHLQIADPWISSMHAMFEWRGQDVWVIDLESRNGTFVNGERVQESTIAPGALLRFGKTEVRFERREERPRPEGLFADGGTVVRYLDDIEAEMQEARAGTPRRDTVRAEPGAAGSGLARRQIAVLEEIGRALVDAGDLEACLSRILVSVARAIRSERASLLLTDETGQMVPRVVEPAGSPPALSNTVISAAAQSRAGILSLDAKQDPRFSGSQSIIQQGIRSALCVPIWASHRVLGMLLFDRGPSEPFTPDDLELVAVVGHQAALAIERARFIDRARATDERRRALELQLPPEMVRDLAAQEPADRDPLEFSRRDAAVLRAALSCGEALAGDPETAGVAIRAGLEALARAVLAEGGAAIRLAGTGLAALFGLARPQPDAGERALRAARALRGQVRALGLAGLDVRAAVDAGPLLAGNLAGLRGLELAAVGEAAERAERLLALAAPGEVLAGAGLRGQPGLVAEAVEEIGGTTVEVFRVV